MNRVMVAIVFVLTATPLAAQTLQPGATVRPDSLQRLRGISPPPHIDIFASGAVRDVSKTDNASAVSGSLGLRYRGNAFVVAGIVNVASKEDTVRAGFASTMLPPAAGRALNSGLLDIRAPRLPLRWLDDHCADNEDRILCHIGLHVYLSASTGRWATAFGTDSAVTGSVLVPTWGKGYGLSYTFVNGTLSDSNSVSLTFDFMRATRHLRGDLNGQDDLRVSLLGTDDRNFAGWESSLNIQYNTILAGLTYYYMDGTMSGFSRGQIVAGVSIHSNLNSKPLRR